MSRLWVSGWLEPILDCILKSDDKQTAIIINRWKSYTESSKSNYLGSLYLLYYAFFRHIIVSLWGMMQHLIPRLNFFRLERSLLTGWTSGRRTEHCVPATGNASISPGIGATAAVPLGDWGNSCCSFGWLGQQLLFLWVMQSAVYEEGGGGNWIFGRFDFCKNSKNSRIYINWFRGLEVCGNMIILSQQIVIILSTVYYNIHKYLWKCVII